MSAEAPHETAAADDRGAGLRTDPVRKLGGLVDVPQRDVGALPDGERAAVGESERARRVLRDAGAAPRRGVSRNNVHAMLIISGSDVAGDVPGLQSVAIAIGTRRARSAATGGSRVSRNA